MSSLFLLLIFYSASRSCETLLLKRPAREMRGASMGRRKKSPNTSLFLTVTWHNLQESVQPTHTDTT